MRIPLTNRSSLVVLIALLSFGGCSFIRRTKDDYMAAGKEQMQKKDYQRAILQFRNAIRKAEKDADPYYELGLAYLAVGDMNNAALSLRKATELNPRHDNAQLRLAEMMAMLGDLDVVREAEKRAQSFLTTSSTNADAITTLAVASLRLGKLTDVDRYAAELLRQSPQNLRASMILALSKIQAKDFTGAEEVFKKSIKRSPNNADAHMAAARFYMLLRRIPEAEQALARTLELKPDFEVARAELGVLYAATDRPDQAREAFKKLNGSKEAKYRPLYGLFLFEKVSREEGVKELLRLKKEYPADRMARTNLVAAYLTLQKITEAESLLSEALQKNPKDTEALLQRASIRLLSNSLPGMEADLSQVVAFKPDSAEAHYLLARLHRARGSRLNERRELTEALRLDPALLGARIDMAQLLIADRAAKAALDLVDGAPRSQAGILPLLIQRNWALLALGDLPRLRTGIEAASKVGRAPEVTLQDALLHLRERKFAVARVLLQEVLKANPEDLRALDALARSHMDESQNKTAALEEVQRFAAANTKSARAQHLLAEWLMANGKSAEARAALTAAQVIDSTYKGAPLALAKLDLVEGRTAEARQTLSTVLAKNQTDFDAVLLLGMVEDVSGRHQQAHDYYQRVLRSEPENVIALNNLAYRLTQDTTQHDLALQYAQKANSLAPDNPFVEDTLGWVLYQKGMYTTALQHLESANAKLRSPVRMYHLAMTYAKLGRAEEGRQVFEAAHRVSPNLPEAEMYKKALSSLVTK